MGKGLSKGRHWSGPSAVHLTDVHLVKHQEWLFALRGYLLTLAHDYSTLSSVLLFLALASFLMFDQNVVFFVSAALEATWHPVEERLVLF